MLLRNAGWQVEKESAADLATRRAEGVADSGREARLWLGDKFVCAVAPRHSRPEEVRRERGRRALILTAPRLHLSIRESSRLDLLVHGRWLLRENLLRRTMLMGLHLPHELLVLLFSHPFAT